MVDAHAPLAEGKMSRCKVKGCSTSHKPRGVLICHFRDNHCQCISPDEIEKSKDFRVSWNALLLYTYVKIPSFIYGVSFSYLLLPFYKIRMVDLYFDLIQFESIYSITFYLHYIISVISLFVSDGRRITGNTKYTVHIHSYPP